MPWWHWIRREHYSRNSNCLWRLHNWMFFWFIVNPWNMNVIKGLYISISLKKLLLQSIFPLIKVDLWRLALLFFFLRLFLLFLWGWLCCSSIKLRLHSFHFFDLFLFSQFLHHDLRVFWFLLHLFLTEMLLCGDFHLVQKLEFYLLKIYIVLEFEGRLLWPCWRRTPIAVPFFSMLLHAFNPVLFPLISSFSFVFLHLNSNHRRRHIIYLYGLEDSHDSILILRVTPWVVDCFWVCHPILILPCIVPPRLVRTCLVLQTFSKLCCSVL